MRIETFLLLAACIGLWVNTVGAQNADLAFEDFEGTNYGTWAVSGTAFGDGPTRGTLLNQMAVEGYRGKGYANSYHGGDDAKGRLTSKTFKIDRKYIQFLVGGGGFEGKTCVNLLIEGKVRRTTTGPNMNPGGSERLEPAQWDVREFVGQNAVLEIVDDATGGWGHICVDEIVQGDKSNGAAVMQYDVSREMRVEKSYINFGVKNGSAKRKVSVEVDGKSERSFDIELADGEPDSWAVLDGRPFHGKTITIKVDKLPGDSKGLSSIDQTDDVKNRHELYHEKLRPQFHFTTQRGWINDPNGLVFYRGEYHLFYQHNPYGWNWGNMHWGHAVSKDLVHWEELPEALYPDKLGTMFSGSAVVDWNNTAGFQEGKEPALVAMLTAAGNPFTQELAYSNDRGRTWTKYEKNPVLGHIVRENRDPKVVWYASGKKWVMALYLDGNNFALFDSADLKHWKKLIDIKLRGDSECPNFFQLPLDGNTKDMHWVFYGANGFYETGGFDGVNFTAKSGPVPLQQGNAWYASQVYSDIPASDGRCIMIPWGRMTDSKIPFHQGMPFNQMMGLPVELKLVSTSEGPRILVNPIRELDSLRARTNNIALQALKPGENALHEIQGELLEIDADISIGTATSIRFDLRGVSLIYDTGAREISCLRRKARLSPVDGKISLRLFVDRTSVDIFGGDGRLYMPMGMALSTENRGLDLRVEGGEARIDSVVVYDLNSAWN